MFFTFFRKRQEALIQIQNQILNRLGISRRIINNTNTNLNNNFTDKEKHLILRVVQRVPVVSRTVSNGGSYPRVTDGSYPRVTGVNEISSQEIFAERIQSFYPSCSVPNHTDHLLWNTSSEIEMRLFYDITFPRSYQAQTQVNVVSSKIRLFKFNHPSINEATTINNLGISFNHLSIQFNHLSIQFNHLGTQFYFVKSTNY